MGGREGGGGLKRNLSNSSEEKFVLKRLEKCEDKFVEHIFRGMPPAAAMTNRHFPQPENGMVYTQTMSYFARNPQPAATEH